MILLIAARLDFSAVILMAARPRKKARVLSRLGGLMVSSVHNSLNGGCAGQGGNDDVLPPAAPFDADPVRVP